jgi:hypothetical protein
MQQHSHPSEGAKCCNEEVSGMENPEPLQVDPLAVLEAELRLLYCQWVATVYPQFVPCYEIDGKIRVMVGRTVVNGEPHFLVPVYTSLEAKDRSSLWKGTLKTDPYFIKVQDVKQAEDFWCNVLRMFVAVQNITEEKIHDLVLIFNHKDNAPLPSPQCVFCHVIDLRKILTANGIKRGGESLKDVQIMGESSNKEKKEEEDTSIDLDESGQS